MRHGLNVILSGAVGGVEESQSQLFPANVISTKRISIYVISTERSEWRNLGDSRTYKININNAFLIKKNLTSIRSEIFRCAKVFSSRPAYFSSDVSAKAK